MTVKSITDNKIKSGIPDIHGDAERCPHVILNIEANPKVPFGKRYFRILFKRKEIT